ncbi:MAG TPA: c-type cytochrome [Gaiellaceae bacterium]|jgi:cytochrome c1
MRRLALLPVLVLAAGCGPARQAQRIPGGDAGRGKDRIEYYGCGACHTIPGVRAATARVGPPLDDFGSRATVAGKLPNTPEGLARWIRDPQRIVPGNDMPDLGISRREARDIAAYLLERT